jgi:hypothetical protein
MVESIGAIAGSREEKSVTQTNIVDRVAHFIRRFVFIKDEAIYRLLALWVIQTHFYKDFEYTGYIFTHSPEPGSGKTRLLEVVELLVSNPSGLLYSPTNAILFRTADGSTQLLDEVDTWTNGENLRGVLNAGFHRGGKVQRNEQGTDGRWVPVPFSVYAPRAMAGIGLGILHGTTRDRTFIVPMVKQTPGERREKFRSKKFRPEGDQLKSEIEAWIKENRAKVTKLYDEAETVFPHLVHLGDRTLDIVEPLAAILDVAYAGVPELEARRTELLEAVNLTRKDGGEFLADRKILRALLRLAKAEGTLVGNASELAAKCELDPKPTEYELAGTLRRYGFDNRSIRIGDSVRYRYEMTREQLAEITYRFDGGTTKNENLEEVAANSG